MKHVVSVIVVALIIGVVIAVVLPSYADYTANASVGAAIIVLSKGKANLGSACSDGTFASKLKTTDIGVPESDPKAYILRAELLRVTPSAVRLRATLTDIYGRPFFGLFRWKAIPQGSFLEFEHTCSAEKKFSWRLIASTVEQKYLPAELRGQFPVELRGR